MPSSAHAGSTSASGSRAHREYSPWTAVRSYAVGPLVYLVDLLVALLSVETSLALFCLITLFYAVEPLPAIHRVISGRGQSEVR